MSSIEALPTADVSAVQPAGNRGVAVASENKTDKNQSFSQVFSKSSKQQKQASNPQTTNSEKPSSQRSQNTVSSNNRENSASTGEVTSPVAAASSPQRGSELPLQPLESLDQNSTAVSNFSKLFNASKLESGIATTPKTESQLNALQTLVSSTENTAVSLSELNPLLGTTAHQLGTKGAELPLLDAPAAYGENMDPISVHDNQPQSPAIGQTILNTELPQSISHLAIQPFDSMNGSVEKQSEINSALVAQNSAASLPNSHISVALRPDRNENARLASKNLFSSLQSTNSSSLDSLDLSLGVKDQTGVKVLSHSAASQTMAAADNQAQSLLARDQNMVSVAREYSAMLQQQVSSANASMEQMTGKPDPSNLLQLSQVIDDIKSSDANPGALRDSSLANRLNTNSPLQSSPTLQLSSSLNNPEWSKEVGQRVMWLANKDIQQAQLQLNPKNLGPVEVRIAINQDQQVSVNFITQSHLVKEALDGAVPRLREMFDQQGLNLSDVNISQESHKQKQQHDHPSSPSQSADHELAENMHDDSVDDVLNIISQEHELGIVDYYA